MSSVRPWTERLWVYDLRTNRNFTLRTNRLKREHLDDFVRCYRADNRYERTVSEQVPRFRCFSQSACNASSG